MVLYSILRGLVNFRTHIVGETVKESGGERVSGSVEGGKGKGSWKAMM